MKKNKEQRFERIVKVDRKILEPLNYFGMTWLISGWFSYINSESIDYMIFQTILLAITLAVIGFINRRVYWRKIK